MRHMEMIHARREFKMYSKWYAREDISQSHSRKWERSKTYWLLGAPEPKGQTEK